jgi:hypothetical protein
MTVRAPERRNQVAVVSAQPSSAASSCDKAQVAIIDFVRLT